MRNDIWEDLDMSVHLAEKQARVINSPVKNASISSRASNATPSNIYRRLYGQSRIYWLHKKYISYVLSLVFMHVTWLAWFLLFPIGKLGQTLTVRSRPEQY